MKEADLKAWGLTVPDKPCVVCDQPAKGICLAATSFICGMPLCDKCLCPNHKEPGFKQIAKIKESN